MFDTRIYNTLHLHTIIVYNIVFCLMRMYMCGNQSTVSMITPQSIKYLCVEPRANPYPLTISTL